MNIVFLVYLFMAILLILASYFDFKYRIVPNEISVLGMIAGIMFSLFIPQLHNVGSSILGILAGGGSLYFIGFITETKFNKDFVGGGDIKLLAMIGAFIGWKMVLIVLGVSTLLAMSYCVIKNIRTTAYAPFLGLGTLICLFLRISL